MRSGSVAAACGVLLVSLAACGGPKGDGQRLEHGGPGSRGGSASVPGAEPGSRGGSASAPAAGPTRIPGIGDWLYGQIPTDSRQVVAVYGDGEDSPNSTIVLYAKYGSVWSEAGRWRGHNGRKGWTTDHHEDDMRSPVGVFTLSDAGGVLADPGTRLPYSQSEAYEVPRSWGEAHRRDFYYVIAVDYNRVPGTPPNDPTRPEGQTKGGGIWMHLDHGDGTLACVSLPEEGITHLLRTLDPAQDPVVVMGDREALMS
ncbi:hypothetical protein [Streptomyces macrolidinus]|nr:hypothetical protein [Streptomyces macrolidinus]